MRLHSPISSLRHYFKYFNKTLVTPWVKLTQQSSQLPNNMRYCRVVLKLLLRTNIYHMRRRTVVVAKEYVSPFIASSYIVRPAVRPTAPPVAEDVVQPVIPVNRPPQSMLCGAIRTNGKKCAARVINGGQCHYHRDSSSTI